MYVGRIAAVGMTDRPFVAYRVSSRSFPNRVARITDLGAAIQPIECEDMRKNPYIAYNCLRVSKNGAVVSNGSHTDPIFERLESGTPPDVALQEVLTEMGYERDDFNTPRIAGIATEDTGFLGIARVDGVEVSSFGLKENSCGFVCTYELNRVDGKSHPFVAASAREAAQFIFDGGLFRDLELPVCSAAWMDELAVYNPETGG